MIDKHHTWVFALSMCVINDVVYAIYLDAGWLFWGVGDGALRQ